VTENTTWLTQEAFDRLQAEYDDRSGPLRTDITKKIEAAREEGDLKENGGYHAAKDEQGKNEARIRQLRQLLENASVGEAPEADGTVQAGMVVTIRFPGDTDTEKFLLGHREANAGSDINVYSTTSPLGGAVLGKAVGTTVDYSLPNGKKLSVDIVDAVPYSG
jgi:transcription elongation factor GreA